MPSECEGKKGNGLSKDSLIKGTLILTLAALVARALGIVQRIPLIHLLGDSGMASYTIAFNVYSIFLVAATAGMPSALSKMVSERTAQGAYAEADRIYRASLLFGAVAGVLMFVLLFWIAPYYLIWTDNPAEALLPIRAIAPALLLFPLIAMMRGFFQGHQHMMPNGISQIVEQIFRVIVSVVLAYVLLAFGLEFAIAGASFGGVAGGLAAIAVMIYFSRRFRAGRKTAGAQGGPLSGNEGEAGDAQGSRVRGSEGKAGGTTGDQTPLPYLSIIKQLLKLSIPIVIYSITVTLIYFIDSSIVIRLLQGDLGELGAEEVLGVLGGRAQSLAGIPIILAIALSQSVVPIISSAFAKKDMAQVGQQTGKVLQLSLLTGLPMVLVICAAARPLNEWIFANDKAMIAEDYAVPVIIALTVTSIFQIVMQTSGAVLMGMGRMKPLMIGVAAGIAVKLIGSYALAPSYGIHGIIGATALCFIVMTVINMVVLRSAVRFHIFGFRRWAGLIAVTVIIAVAAWLLDGWLGQSLRWFDSRWDAFVQTILQAGIAGLLYPVLLFATRTIGLADLAHLPGPLRKLTGPILRRFGKKLP